MKLPVANAQHTKIGTCPHGLPAGACPICSGSGGGGGGSKKIQQNSGEMSWDECFAIGQMMKAQKLAQQKRDEAPNNQAAQIPLNFGSRIADSAQRISEFAQKFQNSTPAIIAKPVVFLLNKVLLPVLNIIKDIPQKIQQVLIKVGEVMDFGGEKLKDISDKLNAMFGELKNSVEKKISDKLKDFKKKFRSIFSLADEDDLQDEDLKLEEMQKIFKEKTTLNLLEENFNKQKGDINDEN